MSKLLTVIKKERQKSLFQVTGEAQILKTTSSRFQPDISRTGCQKCNRRGWKKGLFFASILQSQFRKVAVQQPKLILI